MSKNTNLVPLPLLTPENVFEKTVNQHHDAVKAAEKNRVRRKRERIITRWLLAAFFSGLAVAAYVGYLAGLAAAGI